MRARRLTMLFDGGAYEEFDQNLVSTDPLDFVDSKTYTDRLRVTQDITSLPDAVISATGQLNGRAVVICALELKFIGGSMGAVVGEKITRAIEKIIERQVAARHRVGLGRRTHAGRRHQPDATG